MDHPSALPALPDEAIRRFAQIRDEFTRMMLGYRFGMEQVATRLEILREEFAELHLDNPIEHISTRVKSPESILEKAARQGVELDDGPIAADKAPLVAASIERDIAPDNAWTVAPREKPPMVPAAPPRRARARYAEPRRRARRRGARRGRRRASPAPRARPPMSVRIRWARP